jgi:hypothetical protein
LHTHTQVQPSNADSDPPPTASYAKLMNSIKSIGAECRKHGDTASAAKDLLASASVVINERVNAALSDMQQIPSNVIQALQYHLTLVEGQGCSIAQANEHQHALYLLQHGLAVVFKVTHCSNKFVPSSFEIPHAHDLSGLISVYLLRIRFHNVVRLLSRNTHTGILL